MVSVTDPYGRILGFIDRNRYFFFQQLLSCIHEAEWESNRTSRPVTRKRKICVQFVPHTHAVEQKQLRLLSNRNFIRLVKTIPVFVIACSLSEGENCFQRKEFQDAEEVDGKARQPN
jgi:hypothetical protein